MSIDTQSGIPSQITKGDAVAFEVLDADFGASVWSATIHFSVPGQSTVSFARDSLNGEAHVWNLTNAETATLPAGLGKAVISFSDGSNRQSTAPVAIQIFPDPSATPSTSWARSTLATVQTAITSLSSGTNSSVNINGQQFTKKNLNELFMLRDKLLAEIAAEDAAAAIESGLQRRQLVTRFACT